MDDVRSFVTRYLDHLQDAPLVEALVAQHGVGTVLQACVDVLAGQKPDEVHAVTTFLRDIGLKGTVSEELSTRVRELLPASVLPALRPLLRAPVLQVRRAAIYTIGKLWFASEAMALREVFPVYLDKDPLCLTELLGELEWLDEDRGAQAEVDQVIIHPSYLTRWSALGHLGSWHTSSESGLSHSKIGWLRALSTDPVPLVADESRYLLAEIDLDLAEAAANGQPTAEWRQKRLALERTSPTLTFSTLQMHFLNELSRTKQADYTLEDLAAFVGTQTASSRS